MRKPSARAVAWTGAVIVAAVVAVFRIRLVDGLADQGYFEKYLAFARGTVDGSRLPDFSPAYAWLIALLHGQLQLDVYEIRAVQIAAISVAALAVAWAAEAVGGVIAAIAAGVFVLTSRAALINATDLEPETSILLLGALGLVPLTRARISPAMAIVAGLAFGLSASMRPSALLIVVAIALWLAVAIGRVAAAAFSGGAALPVIAIVLLNLALTGTPVIMDPGTVFYEGMNPIATGYSGVQPRIVKDLEEGRGVDALHVTYRIVASRATGRPLSTDASNRYWTQKAFAFVKTHPLAAIELTARKIGAAVSSYDAWDLVTMVRKERELSMLAIPFGYLFALSLAGLWFGDRARLAPVALALVCTLVPMFVFYVTARQRNAAIPAAAILAGVAVASAFRNRRALAAVVVAIAGGALLSIETHAAAEDRYQWGTATREALLFDEALRGRDSERILLHLDAIGYEPERRNETASSISYHLARTLLRRRQTGDVKMLLERARAEAPGDADVLALSAVVDAARASEYERELALLHDPFTAEWSRIRALADAGRVAEARARTANLTLRIPEWKRPAALAERW